jgi:hypothetical protein
LDVVLPFGPKSASGSSSKDNQKLFYKILKNMRREKDCPLKYIKDKEGKLSVCTGVNSKQNVLL